MVSLGRGDGAGGGGGGGGMSEVLNLGAYGTNASPWYEDSRRCHCERIHAIGIDRAWGCEQTSVSRSSCNEAWAI